MRVRVLAETKDHFDWELIGGMRESAAGRAAGRPDAAYEAVEDEEDEHRNTPQGGAVSLAQGPRPRRRAPPPEEEKEVKTAIVRRSGAVA